LPRTVARVVVAEFLEGTDVVLGDAVPADERAEVEEGKVKAKTRVSSSMKMRKA